MITFLITRRLNMRSNLFRRASLGWLFLLCLATAGSTTRIAAQDSGTTPADTHDDDGFNEGLLGLVGLAGLLGLRRRDRNEVKRGEVNRNDVSRGATSRV
jgi:MYXO-CTERM domain-containing protein